MKRCLFILCILALFQSCDDGNVIVTSFDFDARSDLKSCNGGKDNVFFIINSDPDESISFNFSEEDFDGKLSPNENEKRLTIPLNENNVLTYRTYDSQLEGQTYFCSGVPPTTPKVIEEYKSKDGGNIDLITVVTDTTLNKLDSTITKEFETRAIVHDVTLTSQNSEEEIVEETLRLGTFTKTETFNLSEIDSLENAI